MKVKESELFMVEGVNGYLSQYTGKLDTVLDIGAHVGELSIMAAEKGASAVLAVEADNENYFVLRENCKDYPQITLLQRAVATRSGYIKIYKNRDGNTGQRSICYKPDGLVPDFVKGIELSTIISLFGAGRDIDFCKMDIEGAEHDVLMATPKELLRRIAWFDLDVHNLNNLDYFTGGGSPEAVVNYLLCCGFEIVERSGDDNGFHLMLRRVDALS